MKFRAGDAKPMRTGSGDAVDYLFRQPPRAGVPADPKEYAYGSAGNPEQGVQVGFWLRVIDARMTDARFEAFGGPAAVAAAAWVAEWAAGRRLGEIDGLRGLDIAAALDLPAEAYSAVLVVEDALRAAQRQAEKVLR